MKAPWLLFGSVAILLAVRQNREVIQHSMEASVSWIRNVIARVSQHEGHYDSLNLNSDGAGLSMGILQWSQRTGSLGVLLKGLHAANPQRLLQLVGSSADQVLRVTQQGSLAPVNGSVLWQGPWPDIFRALGREPEFQRVQDHLAEHGQHMAAAKLCAQLLNVKTERSMALFYDRCVQQGQNGVPLLAKRIAARLAGKTLPANKVLELFAHECAAQFLATQPPASQWFSEKRGMKWVKTGPSEWHVMRGSFDYFADIKRRCDAILRDPKLSDSPIEVLA